MYADELAERQINVGLLDLDPNNPRFWTEARSIVPSVRISDPEVQADTRTAIEDFGVAELYNSILLNGFLPLDRIVVRPIEGSDRLVAVEGNRRLAAIKRLLDDIDAGQVEPDEDRAAGYVERLAESLRSLEVLVYEGGEQDIAWILQGIRHISGIRNWDPAQRGRLVAQQIDDEGLGFTTAGRKFGLSAIAVGRLYRGFKALEQMRDHDEYGDRFRPDLFTLFEEAYRNPTVREWLEWDENQAAFANENHLRQFYVWITPDEQGTRRIHEPGNVKHLATLIVGKRQDLISKIDTGDLTFEQAVARHEAENFDLEWQAAISQAIKAVEKLPAKALLAQADEVATELEKLREVAERLLKLLRP